MHAFGSHTFSFVNAKHGRCWFDAHFNLRQDHLFLSGDTPREIQLRQLRNCMKADPAYGAGVAQALGIAASEAG